MLRTCFVYVVIFSFWTPLKMRCHISRGYPRDPQICPTPAEFSSNPNQTHLSMLIRVFKIIRKSQVSEFDQDWNSTQLNSAADWTSTEEFASLELKLEFRALTQSTMRILLALSFCWSCLAAIATELKKQKPLRERKR